MEYLILHFDAPLMSFGGVRIDGRTAPIPVPTASMVTGLIARALGREVTDADFLQTMQDSIEIASAILERGQIEIDYQTADLGNPWMGIDRKTGWPLKGRPFMREAAPASLAGKRQQWRPYIAGGNILTAVWATGPTPVRMEDIGKALLEPAHALYIGRNTCLPARDIYAGVIHADSPVAALKEAAAAQPAGYGRKGEQTGATIREFFLPAEIVGMKDESWAYFPVSGRRDWHLDRHTGTQTLARGSIMTCRN
jgi:CRISPR system Cascade subunit CasD